MGFNFRLFFRLTYKVFFKAKGTHYRLTPRRIRFLFIFYPLYIAIEMFAWLGFLLDEIFFPRYHKQEIHEPVFIIGNMRSGTTFLHRMMAKDDTTFTTMALWEMIFAPSITARKIVWGLAAVDKRLGSPVEKWLFSREKDVMAPIEAHKIGLREAEEDEHLMMHIASTTAAWVAAPVKEEIYPYFFFDRDLPEQEKARVMKFYRNCIQRHLYAHGGEKKLLSKNPGFTPKIDSLYQYFPDARIVYTARNPLSVVPSVMNYLSFGWHLFGDPLEKYPYRDQFIDITRYYYEYPIERMKQAPPGSYTVVDYDDLVANPKETVTTVYNRFGYSLTQQFSQQLKKSEEQARTYRSKHAYSLKQIGLKRIRLISGFKWVFKRFGFDTGFGQEMTASASQRRFYRENRRSLRRHRRKKVTRLAARVSKRRQRAMRRTEAARSAWFVRLSRKSLE
jgi:omega-hydroxy-beta-dihydromenaquinone-9 sulfotransferase